MRGVSLAIFLVGILTLVGLEIAHLARRQAGHADATT